MSKTLTSLFVAAGAKIEFVTDPAKIVLQKFAEKYSSEVALDLDNNEVLFGTEDQQFKIRADLNHDLDIVYIGTITSFCPTTVEFSTGYVSSLDVALKKLIEREATARKKRKSNPSI